MVLKLLGRAESVTKKWDSIYYLIILLNIVPLVASIFYIHLFGYNLPFWDQYNTDIVRIIKLHEGTLSLSDFLVLHNDFRPIVTSIVSFIVLYFTDNNFLILSYVSVFMLIISYIALIKILLTDIEINKLTLILLMPFSYYFFNLALISGYLWSIAIYWSTCLLFTVLSIYCAVRSAKMDLLFISSIVFAIAATFSFTSGIFVWPSVLLILILCQPKPIAKGKVILWSVMGTLTFAWSYLYMGFHASGPHGYSGYAQYLSNFLNYPVQKIMCIFGSIGTTVEMNPRTAFLFGILLIVIIIFTIRHKEKFITTVNSKVWWGLLIYSLISSLSIALTRSGQGDFFGSVDQILFVAADRHLTSIFLIPIAIYALYLISLFGRSEETKRQNMDLSSSASPSNYSMVLGLIAGLLIVGYISGFSGGIAAGQNNLEVKGELESIILSYQDQPDEQLLRIYPHAETIQNRLIGMEQYYITPFNKKLNLSRFYWSIPSAIFASGEETLIAGYYKKSPNVRLGSESMPAIFEHPQGPTGTTIVYENIDIREGSHLEFSIGIDEGVWDKPESDGVTFEIHLHDPIANTTQEVFSYTLDPAHAEGDRGWHYFTIPLEEYLAENVSVQFITRPNGNPAYDWAWWGDPKIVW